MGRISRIEIKLTSITVISGFSGVGKGTLINLLLQQYDQQANQVKCSKEERGWYNNGDDSNLFGLEPNYGCCTANFGQGFPKLALSAFMRAPDGAALCVPQPCVVK